MDVGNILAITHLSIELLWSKFVERYSETSPIIRVRSSLSYMILLKSSTIMRPIAIRIVPDKIEK
jgi:hypothetical protein